MIQLTSQEGALVAVNPLLLWHVRAAAGDQTALYSAGGSALFVQESYGEVLKRLRAWDDRS